MTELLEGFSQRTWYRPYERIAVKVLFAEHAAHTQVLVHVVVAFDRVNAVPGTRSARAVIAYGGVVKDQRWIVWHRQLGQNGFCYRVYAFRTDNVQHAIALHACAGP